MPEHDWPLVRLAEVTMEDKVMDERRNIPEALKDSKRLDFLLTGVVGTEDESNPMNESERKTRITVDEIADDLGIGVVAVRRMLEARIIPAVRLGRRWIVTRHVYRQWVRTCGQTRIP